MIARGIKFLEEGKGSGKVLESYTYGAKCLLGLTIFKHTHNPDHPVVRETLEICRRQIARGANQVGMTGDTGHYDKSNYSNAMALMFLCELDVNKYQSEINTLVRAISARQQRSGAWTYIDENKGDTSQVQYVMLALWTANAKGIKVDQRQVALACNWLMRTQDRSGAWAYMGTDPGSFNLIQQSSQVKHSIAVAGLGSVYIAADILGFSHAAVSGSKVLVLPSVLRPVNSASGPAMTDVDAKKIVNPANLERCLSLGNKWCTDNFSIVLPNWNYINLYALERYHSFREKHEGRSEAEPDWYNKGVDLLRKKQAAYKDGGWPSDHDRGRDVSTCLACLFLMRSTKKSIGQLSTGELTGNMGLPPDGALRMRNGQIVNSTIAKDLGDVLAMLEEDEDSEELEKLFRSSIEVKHSNDASTRSEQAAKLRTIVSHKDYKLRLFAVKALAKSRGLDDVPILIYALSDPDVRVIIAARDGLRSISRRFKGGGLKNVLVARPEDDVIKAAQANWTEWYKTVRPDAVVDLSN